MKMSAKDWEDFVQNPQNYENNWDKIVGLAEAFNTWPLGCNNDAVVSLHEEYIKNHEGSFGEIGFMEEHLDTSLVEASVELYHNVSEKNYEGITKSYNTMKEMNWGKDSAKTQKSN